MGFKIDKHILNMLSREMDYVHKHSEIFTEIFSEMEHFSPNVDIVSLDKVMFSSEHVYFAFEVVGSHLDYNFALPYQEYSKARVRVACIVVTNSKKKDTKGIYKCADCGATDHEHDLEFDPRGDTYCGNCMSESMHKLCEHEYGVEANMAPDSGTETFTCKKCGDVQEIIYY